MVEDTWVNSNLCLRQQTAICVDKNNVQSLFKDKKIHELFAAKRYGGFGIRHDNI